MSIAAINPYAWTLSTVPRGGDESPILAPRSSPSAPITLEGYAMPWGVLSTSLHVVNGTHCYDYLKEGAFDKSFVELNAGRLSVPLIHQHREGQGEFLFMHDRGVFLENEGGGLYLYVDARYANRKGDALAWFMQRNPECKYLSCGYRPRKSTMVGTGSVKQHVITEADLIEISLTDSPGMGKKWTEFSRTKRPWPLSL